MKGETMLVRDIMRTNVVTVPPEYTVRELTRLLSDEGITGVPVVTDAGEVLGVVSSTDVVRLAAEAAEVPVTGTRWVPVGVAETSGDPEDEAPDPYSDYFLPEDAPVVRPEWGAAGGDGPMDSLTVSDIMTPVTFSVEPGSTLRDLADFLVRGRIHRALVLEDGRLEGIVTTMDVLQVLATGEI
ncbi:MAG: CBS domain-containing protein [Longimicrobiales bacterium]|nr:CBS domain-containing protein [Longimicrobiales bacterium]